MSDTTPLNPLEMGLGLMVLGCLQELDWLAPTCDRGGERH